MPRSYHRLLLAPQERAKRMVISDLLIKLFIACIETSESTPREMPEETQQIDDNAHEQSALPSTSALQLDPSSPHPAGGTRASPSLPPPPSNTALVPNPPDHLPSDDFWNNLPAPIRDSIFKTASR